MTADRYQISDPQARLWIEDIELKGTQSIFFEQVKPVAMEFFGPILSLLMPVVQQLLQSAVNAAMYRASEATVEPGSLEWAKGTPVRERIARNKRQDEEGLAPLKGEVCDYTDNPDV